MLSRQISSHSHKCEWDKLAPHVKGLPIAQVFHYFMYRRKPSRVETTISIAGRKANCIVQGIPRWCGNNTLLWKQCCQSNGSCQSNVVKAMLSRRNSQSFLTYQSFWNTLSFVLISNSGIGLPSWMMMFFSLAVLEPNDLVNKLETMSPSVAIIWLMIGCIRISKCNTNRVR